MAEALAHKLRLQTKEIGTVIFDLDGTLVDSAPDIADALDELLQERGLEPIGLDGTRKLIGHGIPNLVKKALALRGQETEPDELASATSLFQQFYATRLPAKAVAYPGVAQCLETLKNEGWRLVVCTNKLEVFSRSILKGLNLDSYFEIVAGPDTFGVAKPNPEHLLRALPENRPSDYRVVMVGDSEVDIETAHAAHIPIIAVTYGYSKTPLAELKPQGLTGNFSEVPKLVKQLAEMPGAKICAP